MFVAKWYTRASRVRIVIAKFDGRWKLPGGPYPIPELVALIGGILLTLFLLPRLGQPVLTGAVGAGIAALAVGVMRRMPYSPVKFGTRIHRIARLYSNPVSTSGAEALHAVATVSAVRPDITILDAANRSDHTHRRQPHPLTRAAQTPVDTSPQWHDLLSQPRSAAADLFS